LTVNSSLLPINWGHDEGQLGSGYGSE